MSAAPTGENQECEGAGIGPLAGLRVLELGSTIAGPFCGRLMADFGAEVIKVEPLEGDPVRLLGRRHQGVSLYATSILRNKKLISVDLKAADGRALVEDLALRSDILVENFRPGALERLGLGFDRLAARNPGLIMVRISGYGQSGPLSAKAGYGVVAEAFGGVRHMTGDPDRPPARVAVALTDQLTALYAVFGALAAVHQRHKTGRGQIVDAALYEAAFSLMEPHVPAFEKQGVVPMRTGSALAGTAPNNLYPSSDGGYVLIASNNDAVFARLARAMDRADLLTDPRFATQTSRASNREAIDAEVATWTGRRSAAEIEDLLDRAGVPASRVYTMPDIFAHPHYRARDMLKEVTHRELGTVTLAGVVPKLSDSPGAIRWSGGAIGEHTREVLAETLGLSEGRIAELAAAGVIHCGDIEGGAQEMIKNVIGGVTSS